MRERKTTEVARFEVAKEIAFAYRELKVAAIGSDSVDPSRLARIELELSGRKGNRLRPSRGRRKDVPELGAVYQAGCVVSLQAMADATFDVDRYVANKLSRKITPEAKRLVALGLRFRVGPIKRRPNSFAALDATCVCFGVEAVVYRPEKHHAA